MVSKELTGTEIAELIGTDGLVITYPELYRYDSIDELFSNGINKVVILYLQDKRGETYQGHWVVLTKHRNRVLFFDSYGILPDNELRWNNSTDNRELNQHRGNYLTTLLKDYADRGGTVEYNEKRFQEHNHGVNTCGRYAVLRAIFYRVPLKTFQRVLDDIRRAGVKLDEAVVCLTDSLKDYAT